MGAVLLILRAFSSSSGDAADTAQQRAFSAVSDRPMAGVRSVVKSCLKAEKPVPQNKNLSRPPSLNETQSLTHHNATLSMSPSPTVGFGDAGAGGMGGAAAAWAA